MRRARYLAAGLPAFVLAALTAGCSSSGDGELIVVMQSDMSIPKDIDSLRLEITARGAPQNDQEWNGLGQEGAILFPATIGILAPEDPTLPVTIRVTARTGGGRFATNGPAGTVRVLREVTTTVPQDRVATLHVPVQFLCDGSGKDNEAGAVENTACGKGTTCVAGECVPIDLSSEEMPEYEQGDVFGDGTGQGDGVCFDVTGCMEGGELALPVLENDACTVTVDPSEGKVNLAILTEVEGICGDDCFVPLDSESASGWVRSPDAPEKVIVPKAVCSKLGHEVRGIWKAKTPGDCPVKTVSIPTCGPWSAVGKESDQKPKFVARASGQHHPTAIAAQGNLVFWSTSGLFIQNEASATSMQASAGGVSGAVFKDENGNTKNDGKLQSFDEAPTMSARDLVVADNLLYWTVASAAGSGGEIRQSNLDGTAKKTLTPADNPEGLAVADGWLLWTEFTQGHIMMLNTAQGGGPITLVTGDPAKRPSRIAADKKYACWTNEGVGTMATGSVECVDYKAGQGAAVKAVASNMSVPRAIALDDQGLYWATFDKAGSIYMARRDAGEFQTTMGGAIAVTELAKGQAYPNGIAVDSGFIYWTNWGDGTVWRLKKGAGGKPEQLAFGQRRPAEITLGGSFVLWINAGESLGKMGAGMNSESSVAGNGAVMMLDVTKL